MQPVSQLSWSQSSLVASMHEWENQWILIDVVEVLDFDEIDNARIGCFTCEEPMHEKPSSHFPVAPPNIWLWLLRRDRVIKWPLGSISPQLASPSVASVVYHCENWGGKVPPNQVWFRCYIWHTLKCVEFLPYFWFSGLYNMVGLLHLFTGYLFSLCWGLIALNEWATMLKSFPKTTLMSYIIKKEKQYQTHNS